LIVTGVFLLFYVKKFRRQSATAKTKRIVSPTPAPGEREVAVSSQRRWEGRALSRPTLNWTTRRSLLHCEWASARATPMHAKKSCARLIAANETMFVLIDAFLRGLWITPAAGLGCCGSKAEPSVGLL